MISEVDIRDMKEIVERIDDEAIHNGKASPFSDVEYFKIMGMMDALLEERRSKVARLFLPLTKWI